MSILDSARVDQAKLQARKQEQPKPQTAPGEMLTLSRAGHQYLDTLQRGKSKFFSTTVPELDYALSGGLEAGEMVIFAARPSMGKSAAAMQCLHGWTLENIPCCFVSEEMSSLMLGKRTIQFITPMHQEHWSYQAQLIRNDLDTYQAGRAPCYVIEPCRTAAIAAERIERCVKQNGVKAAVVDYAQLLQSPGKSRYEQITNTSIALRQLASRTGIVLLVLCQLNREIESRTGGFAPKLSDLRDTGQLEQDADVVLFLHWPHRAKPSEPKDHYQFHIAKNRSREIKQAVVDCRFDPNRQTFTDALPQHRTTGIPL